MFLVGIPVVFLIGVLYALVSGLTTVFVVPLMIQTDSGVLAAWRRLWGSIKAAWKQYLAYVVIALLLTVAAGIIASIAVSHTSIGNLRFPSSRTWSDDLARRPPWPVYKRRRHPTGIVYWKPMRPEPVSRIVSLAPPLNSRSTSS